MTEFNQYYQDELAYLRDMGEEFSNVYPKLAPFLVAEGNDPDVERLLEGFAFLTGRLRQKLDDQLPELTEEMFSLVEPQYLRPLPSASILEFSPIENAVSERKIVPAGTSVDSKPVDGTSCRFQSSYDVELQPLKVDSLKYETTGVGSELRLTIKLLSGLSTDALTLDSLRFYLHGELVNSTGMFLWLSNYIKDVSIETGEPGYRESVRLSNQGLVSPGFDHENSLFPVASNTHPAQLQLMEYFSFPQKFLFKEVSGLEKLRHLPVSDEFTLVFRFNRPFEPQMRPTADSFKLFCTPVVNVFEWDADPIRMTHDKVEYRVRPTGSSNQNYEIYSVDQVSGWLQGSRERREYMPFLSFKQGIRSDSRSAQNFYQLRRQPATIGKGHDSYIKFASAEDSFIAGEKEVVSIQLTCCNRHLPEKLKAGDICVATSDSPEFAQFHNLTVPTATYSSPGQSQLHWRLISNLSLTHDSLAKLSSLKQIVSTYNFPAFHNNQAGRDAELKLQGIQDIQTTPVISLINGAPVKGNALKLIVDSSRFNSEGDLYLFASLLNQFYAAHVSINSFVQFTVEDKYRGETYRWKQNSGQIPLI